MCDLDSATSVLEGVDRARAALGESVRLLVTGATSQWHHLGSPERVEFSVLTVHGHYL
jgi:hypothetical protein